MKHTPSIRQNTDDSPVVLELQDVKKSFFVPGGDPLLILDIPFFQIDAGELVALEGQSGSGKSTLVNILTRLIEPDSGNLSVDNVEIKSLQNIRNYQNLFNITSQDSFLLNGSIKDNIVFGKVLQNESAYSSISV